MLILVSLLARSNVSFQKIQTLFNKKKKKMSSWMKTMNISINMMVLPWILSLSLAKLYKKNMNEVILISIFK